MLDIALKKQECPYCNEYKELNVRLSEGFYICSDCSCWSVVL